MKLTIEQFSSILCFGLPASAFTEEGDFCRNITYFKDHEYNEILDSVQMLHLKYGCEFLQAVGEYYLIDIKDDFASKSEFMCFVLSRCKKLSETPTLFSFILVCIFIYKVIFDVFQFFEVECFTVAKIASKCLTVAFYRRYVDLFDKNNGFEGFVNYCEKLNESLLIPSDEDSESESENSSLGLEKYTFPNINEIIDMIESLKEIDGVDIVLTDFEKKLLYERDSLPIDIDPSEDILIPFLKRCKPIEHSYARRVHIAMPNLNVKSKCALKRLNVFCLLCQNNCYKHVVFAAKELKVGEFKGDVSCEFRLC